jgi:mono/diheme cytochrome c family protein
MVSRRRSSIYLAVAAIAAVVAGCGNGGNNEPDLANGKRLYLGEVTKEYQKDNPKYQACGGCHALARAGTKANTGPDLDAAFAQARTDGMTTRTVRGVVDDQINSPRRGSLMPADIVSGDDARDVAAYVAEVAAQPGKDQGELAQIPSKANAKPIVAKNGTLTIPADPSGATKFASSAAIATAGSLAIQMPNPSTSQHDIALKPEGGKGAEIGKGPVVGKGGTSKFTADLKPGKYQFLCTVPGHAENGMVGTLTVK